MECNGHEYLSLRSSRPPDRLQHSERVQSDVPAAEYLAEHLDGHGFKRALHQIDVGGVRQANLVAWAGPPRPDGLIISGHIDTVPFEGQPGWERDPFKMEVADDRIYGRGTADMKGFLAQCAEAARTLDRSRLRGRWYLSSPPTRKSGCAARRTVAPELQDLLGDVPQPNLAWIGEPSSYRASFARTRVSPPSRSRCAAAAAIAATPEQGVNSIAVMGKVIETIGRSAGRAPRYPRSAIRGDFSRRTLRRDEFRHDHRRRRL